MEKVIVAIRKKGDPHICDLELPTEIPVSDLTNLITEALHWDNLPSGQVYSIKVSPQGKILSQQETLFSAQVRSGSMIEFAALHQSEYPDKKLPVTQSKIAPKSGGVVSGWISLLSEAQSLPPESSVNWETPSELDKPVDNSGFTWKKIS